jgi:amidase
MKLSEYCRYDALGLAELVAKREVSAKELAETAAAAIEAINPEVNAVVETYPDRIEHLSEESLGNGPFRGVPFLMKDVFGHEAGRKIEFGSRLCQGMVVQEETYVCKLLKASGVNILGRSATPEYSMAGTTETAFYGNTSTPWKKGYSAGGSTGGGMAAVVAGIVPIAHGSDIAGSLRIPASFCGGIGLKPTRGRVSAGPMGDEGGFGLAQNFVQTKTIRDTAAMLDCLSLAQVGDPFAIPKPAESYASLVRNKPGQLRIGWSAQGLAGFDTDREVAAAVESTARLLTEMGHEVVEETPEVDGGLDSTRGLADVWFFGLDLRLEGFAKRSGHPISPDVLEPVTYLIYQYAKSLTSADFFRALGVLNRARRQLARNFTKYDVWLTPTTPRVAEPWGQYNLGRTDIHNIDEVVEKIFWPVVQFTFPYNVLGTPAISLPLATNSSGLPIGIQLGGRPAEEHVILQLAAALEEARPWSGRQPTLYAGS